MNQDLETQQPRLLAGQSAASTSTASISAGQTQVEPVDPFEAAFQRHLPELTALEPEQILHINVELPAAIATALGVWKEVSPLREQLTNLSGFDVQQFDDLPSYAQTLSFANTLYLLAIEPVEEIKPIYERALTLRETLNLDVRALVHRGLLDGKQIEDLTGTVGHKNVATDLQILSVLLRTHWAGVEGKSATSRAEIDDAATLAYRLLVVIGEREQADINVSAAADTRARAFTVFLHAYDEVRRAVNFIRWKDGDAEEFVPSLYVGRGRKKAVQTDVARAKAPDASPASGAPSPAGTSAPATPAASSPATLANGPYMSP